MGQEITKSQQLRVGEFVIYGVVISIHQLTSSPIHQSLSREQIERDVLRRERGDGAASELREQEVDLLARQQPIVAARLAAAMIAPVLQRQNERLDLTIGQRNRVHSQ